MAPKLLNENDAPVRLRFTKDVEFQYRRFAKGETPLQWFYPREANALLKTGSVEIDTTAQTWSAAVESERENGPSDPPPLRAGLPHDAPADAKIPTRASEAPEVERRADVAAGQTTKR